MAYRVIRTVADWLFCIAGWCCTNLLVRRILRKRSSVHISYVGGPQIDAPKGHTLLEMSRAHGVPHTALCGGRGRCTPCRGVVEEGLARIDPPSAAERQSLAAVGAAPNMRLACQIRPVHPVTVFRVFQPDGARRRSHSSQGEEKELAILFLDIRGFTARTYAAHAQQRIVGDRSHTDAAGGGLGGAGVGASGGAPRRCG